MISIRPSSLRLGANGSRRWPWRRGEVICKCADVTATQIKAACGAGGTPGSIAGHLKVWNLLRFACPTSNDWLLKQPGRTPGCLRPAKRRQNELHPDIREIGRGAEGSATSRRMTLPNCTLPFLTAESPISNWVRSSWGYASGGESVDEMAGFLEAANARVNALRVPSGRARPVVLPSYNGARRDANLTPLLALLLQAFWCPGPGPWSDRRLWARDDRPIFRELGIMPSASRPKLGGSGRTGLAFVPITALCPGLANQLALRARMGVRNSAHSLVR